MVSIPGLFCQRRPDEFERRMDFALRIAPSINPVIQECHPTFHPRMPPHLSSPHVLSGNLFTTCTPAIRDITPPFIPITTPSSHGEAQRRPWDLRPSENQSTPSAQETPSKLSSPQAILHIIPARVPSCVIPACPERESIRQLKPCDLNHQKHQQTPKKLLFPHITLCASASLREARPSPSLHTSSRTATPLLPIQEDASMATHTTTPHMTEHGTPCSKSWDDDWIVEVEATEKELGRRCCGAHAPDGVRATA